MKQLNTEIKLFINNKGLFNLYIINYCLKSRPSTLLILFTTSALAVLNDLPPTAKLSLSVNVITPPTNITAPPINVMGVLQARPNYILNGLTIGLKSAQPIATAIAIILPGMQTPTSITP